jgi:hypothetical protein
MLSSIWPANQHRVKPAGDSAGQPLNRVFERYRMTQNSNPAVSRITCQECTCCTPFGTESLQPGHFGGQVVGVDVDMHSARSILEPMDEQPELLAVQRGSVVLGVPVELGKWPPGGCIPERQRATVIGWRHVNHDLGQPAVVRHSANLLDLPTRAGRAECPVPITR